VGAEAILTACTDALEALDEWTVESVQAAMDAALIDGLGLKRGKAYAPVRTAVTGSGIAPPLPESMALLGKARVLRRLRAAA
jgi:glutamyl-tRNA synthetase